MHIKVKEHSLLKNTTSYIVIRLSWCQALCSMNFISRPFLSLSSSLVLFDSVSFFHSFFFCLLFSKFCRSVVSVSFHLHLLKRAGDGLCNHFDLLPLFSMVMLLLASSLFLLHPGRLKTLVMESRAFICLFILFFSLYFTDPAGIFFLP